MNDPFKPLIGITMGDPSGIGPEVIVKALSNRTVLDQCRPVVIGDPSVIDQAIRLAKVGLHVQQVHNLDQVGIDTGVIYVFQPEGCMSDSVVPGRVEARAGHAAFVAIKTATELACNRSIEAIVTAPIHKQALNAAGHAFAGHTEILASLTGTKDYSMLLVYGQLRVVHVTTHVPLSRVAGLISTDRIIRVIELGHKGCQELGIDHPRIGVAGLNPHAGDGGLFGDEELRQIAPAIQWARDRSLDVYGPIPADTLFARAASGQFDLCVAMYHDQGHIPLKMMGFRFSKEGHHVGGVNITLGLPIIRTSVDHGTAFDIAGKGLASPESMIQAIECAITMVRNRSRHDAGGS
ncbi:MAG: 4-hydroxythreonine-4-phosphate dehydrogenase PdxA [Sedimentisphaerales bacterium]|jgi:4-hydroxythreonine-4-phosphate dehydrogenase|nr:4-hydroxythreonine-4-phosphate dehydrogenase PdxA [Sedimentisphaerales bacterium]